jgi:hypothetical protein
MGRSNRARQQQKQQQQQRRKQRKRKKQKGAGGAGSAKRKNLAGLDEMLSLSRPVLIALANGEPPPPGIMADWARSPATPAGEKLRVLLVGFIDYLFHGEQAMGQLGSLVPYRRNMLRTELASLYPLLFCYCLISENALAQGDLHKLVDTLQGDTLQQGLGADYPEQVEELFAPFYLFLWAMGLSVPDQPDSNLRFWLQDWLRPSPLYGLITQLAKFLKLKAPKPQQKAVKELELALNRVGWDNVDEWDKGDEWRDGLGRLLCLFLQQRLTARQRNADAWNDLPTLSVLAGLTETQATPNWSVIRFEKNTTTTLNLLNRKIDAESMPYGERLQLEALKCRLLSHCVAQSDFGREDFERQLGLLLDLLSSGVPPAQVQLAEHCLEASCEWLANEVGSGYLPPPNIERLGRIYRQRPDDYRVAVLVYLASQGREPVSQKTVDITLVHVHFAVFLQGLKCRHNPQTFLDMFYWPLTSEVKKSLFTQSCREIFLGMNEADAELYWEHWRQLLVDVEQDPFAAIVKGHACEAEMLFYSVLALIDSRPGISWLHGDQISSLVGSAANLLTKHASDFNQRQVIELLNALCANKHAASLFHTWEPVLIIVSKILYPHQLETFLRLAVQTLSKQEDYLADKYRGLYAVCRQLPTLRQYLPGKKKTARRKKSENSPYSPNLDLFGDSL